MLIVDIETKLIQCESGIFQKVCNEILCNMNYVPFNYTGSQIGTNKTKKGTPDSVFTDLNGNYIYVEYTTTSDKLNKKIKEDVEKCLNKIMNNPQLYNKVSKIIFMHNSKNPDEADIEKIKNICNDKNIKFEIYGIDFIANKLQNECKSIAISLLGLKDDSNQLVQLTDESLDKIAKKLKNSDVSEYKNNSINDIKIKIENLYKEAISIVNNDDAFFYISVKDKENLKKIYTSLEAFEFIYNDMNQQEALIYYHNLIVILSRIDVEKAIEKYICCDEKIKEDFNIRHYYAIMLINCNRIEEANIVLEDLYFEKKCESVMSTLIRAYLLLGKYKEIIEILSCEKKENFDNHGLLASILVISKDKVKKLKEQEIIKLNNNKFNKMPLFFSCLAKLLYQLDKRKKIYKEYFKKGILLLKDSDVLSIDIMCEDAIYLHLEDEIIKYLTNIELSPYLKIRLLNLLIKKGKLSKKEIDKIIELKRNIDINDIDIGYIEALISENKGKELEAIKKYEKSFLNTSNINSAFKYVNLSMKNKSNISPYIINKLRSHNSLDITMLLVEAYKYMGNDLEAINFSYKALYLNNKNKLNKDVFKQYWGCITFCGKNLKRDFKIASTNAVITLGIENNKDKIIVLEDDEYFEENQRIFDACIIRSYSDLGAEIINHKINDLIEFENKKYIIKDIKNKHTYFYQECFKYVIDSKAVEILSIDSNNPKEFITNLQDRIVRENDSKEKIIDIYESGELMPLSALINEDKLFYDYAKLINDLLNNDNRVFLSGENNINVDLSKGIVLDITSLIVLTLLDLLNIFNDEICKKIFITTSFKNNFQYFFKNLIRKQDEIERSIGLNNNKSDNDLLLTEIPVSNMIEGWKKVNQIINKFQIIDIEYEKDNILNDESLKILDKTQLDLIALAKDKSLPFICDDRSIRSLSNIYNVVNTNSTIFLKYCCNDYSEYLLNIQKYIACNYLYTFWEDSFVELFMYLFTDFSGKSKNEFKNVIKSLLKNKTSFNYYSNILKRICDNLKRFQYINISNEYYENLAITFVIETIENEIIK